MESSDGAIPDLTFDIITLILLRLPIRSLCRFKCVSRAWLRLISNRKFAKNHFNCNNKNRIEQLCFPSDPNDLFSLDLESPDSTAIQLRFGDEQSPIQFQAIWGSCDGLLLLSDLHLSLFLANPSTGEYKQLPRSPFFLHSGSAIESYGLGYDSSDDDYKVVQICPYPSDFEANENIVSVYSLKTNSWRSTECCPHRLLLYSCSQGFYVTGALHWLGKSEVIALDLGSESFYSMPLPGSEGGVEDLDELNVIGGCLCRIEGKADFVGPVRVWVMEEYGIRNSWVKYTFDFAFPSVKWMLPSRTGKLLFYAGTTLFVYDIQEGEFEYRAVDFPDDTVPTACAQSLISLMERN